MISIIPARPEMARMLKPQAAQIALGQVMDEPSLASAIASGLSLAAADGGRLLAVGGIAEQWDGRAIIWGLLSDDIGAAMVDIHRAVSRALAASQFRRIEAHVAVEHAAGRRWAELLGFTHEGTMRKFWQGHDYDLFARVRE